MQLTLIISTLLGFGAVSAFVTRSGVRSNQPKTHMQLFIHKDVSRKIGLGLASFFISSGIINHSLDLSLPVPAAVADVRAQQKRTYFRFTPKFKAGMEFYDKTLSAAIAKEDWNTVGKFFEDYVYKPNKDDPSNSQMDSPVNQQFFRPMTVLSGSFAERSNSPKTKALMEQEVAFETAMKGLEGCTKDLKGDGFFAGTIKMPEGAARVKQAKESYAAGKTAINEYVKIFNSGLMLELNKLDGIP